MNKNNQKFTRPILKWAGGKTQLLKELIPRIPKHYNRYIEPFIGGGALFFALKPTNAIIADSNPELILTYQQLARNIEKVIEYLEQYTNTSETFYKVRAQDWKELPKAEAAARMIYLNKTCFNGLYRVNRQGRFNTPFGRYKNPNICDIEHLHAASDILKNATIICGNYLDVLNKYASPGDFIFLDPPYIPVSKYGDFKRYTKEQFYEKDQIQLSEEFHRLYNLGCSVILTNSHHPLVEQLYIDFPQDVISTRRSISSKGTSRSGEDLIVTAIHKSNKNKANVLKQELSDQVYLYPPTRFMGSKRKLLNNIWNVAQDFHFDSVLDMFSGSGIVSYMFKAEGKKVISNDYMTMSSTFSKAMRENNTVTLPRSEAERLLKEPAILDTFVEETFQGLYYSDAENKIIDIIRTNIRSISNEYKRAIAMSALIRACIKKRPRGIFTYTGNRYNDGRRDLKITLQEQFLEAVDIINKSVFDNGRENISINMDAMSIHDINPDLVYIDPPYYSPLSDNEYVRRYHFVEGLSRDWDGVEIQAHTKTKKFKSYPTPFSTRTGAADAFSLLFKKYKDSILIVSYSSNSIPTKEEMVKLIKQYKDIVEVIPIDYTYSFGNQAKAKTHRNNVQEFLFIGY